jgi:hypothetical protein
MHFLFLLKNGKKTANHQLKLKELNMSTMQFTDYIKKLQEGKIPPQFLKGKDAKDKDKDKDDKDKDSKDKDSKDKDEDDEDDKKSKGKFLFGKKVEDDKKELKEAYAYTHTWTKDELLEFISELEDDEVQEVGDFLMGELMEDDEFEDDDFETGSEDEDEDEDELKEGHFFAKNKSVMDREKKKNKAARKMKAKLLKKYYKKNKASIARKAKIYRKKAKRNPNKVFHHKGV